MRNAVAAIVPNDRNERIVNQCFVLHHEVDNPLPIARHPDTHDVTKSVQRFQDFGPDLTGQRILPSENRQVDNVATPDYPAPEAALAPIIVR